MSELEIMREFDEEYPGIRGMGLDDADGFQRAIIRVKKWLEPAAKREIHRVLTEVQAKVGHCIIGEYLYEYSPKPTFCEGMQEAIDNGLIVYVKLLKGYSLTDTEGCRRKIERCPYCKDGKNCIGNK